MNIQDGEHVSESAIDKDGSAVDKDPSDPRLPIAVECAVDKDPAKDAEGVWDSSDDEPITVPSPTASPIRQDDVFHTPVRLYRQLVC